MIPTSFRPFRNSDPPALAALWNRALDCYGVARPLSVHEFEAVAFDRVDFESAGLIVAVREDDEHAVVGFAHAGFGPCEPEGPSHAMCPELGTIAMLIVDPSLEDAAEIEQELILRAERYLRRRGTEVFYAGGQYPLNPFYWGLYGASEFAGVLSGHIEFHRALLRAGYEPVGTTVMLEAHLNEPEPRDPRSLLLKRQTLMEVIEDGDLPGWWPVRAMQLFQPTTFRLVTRTEPHQELARATTWNMEWFGRTDRRSRIGLIALIVAQEQRRKGYGRQLVGEICRQARLRMTDCVAVQTGSTNLPALALYEAAGFIPVDSSTLYRLPAALGTRSLSR